MRLIKMVLCILKTEQLGEINETSQQYTKTVSHMI